MWQILFNVVHGTTVMQLLQIGESQEQLWDDYVIYRTNSVTDLSAWRHVLALTYGIDSHFMVAKNDNEIMGALGLFSIKHPVFGHYLTTAPFSTDGGLYYENMDALSMLVEWARGLSDQLDADYLLIRSRDTELEEFIIDRHYCTAIIDQKSGPENIWTDVLPGKTRNQVRRGKKEGFSIYTGHEYASEFYDVFHRHMRDLGSPAHSRDYYRNIVRFLGEKCRFIIVRDGSELAGGALLFEVNGTAMNYHTVSLKHFNRRCPNYLLYWHMIESSARRGNQKFDMGRTETDSTNLRFKKNWGSEIVGLKYNYYLRKIKDVPYVDPRNPRYSLPIAIWKKLPVAITKKLGPWAIRGIA